MKKFRAAVWQYYKRFLSLFAVCAVVSLIFQGLWLEPIGEVFPVGIPFFSPFFFLFVLCTGNTFDRLFLQMHLPHRTQQKAFWAFLPTALLGAGVSVAIARWVSAGAPKRSGYDIYTVSYYFQTSLFGNEIFGGSMARITWLSFLLCALSLLVTLFLARIIYMLWKSTAHSTKIVLLIVCAVFVFFVLPIFLLIALFLEDITVDWSILEGVCAFCFGSAYSAPSRFAAKVLQLTVLALFLHLLQNREAYKACRKPKSPRRAAVLCARIAVFCAVAAFGVWTVYYCTPVSVDRLEFDEEAQGHQVEYYAYTDIDSPQDLSSAKKIYRPNEKAYHLLKMQERFAEAPYRVHIARHMVNQYYTPTEAPLPYTEYEHGKQYFETAVTSNTAYTVFTDYPYSSGYGLEDFQNLYCRYLYEGGERDAALAYYTAQSKAPALSEDERSMNWMPYLRTWNESESPSDAMSVVLKQSGNDSNFLLYLYLQPDGQDAPFAAREISVYIQPKNTRDNAAEGIEKFSLLWDIAQSDAARTALAEEIADYAVLVTDNVMPYTTDYRETEIFKALRALCEKAGVEDRLPNGI